MNFILAYVILVMLGLMQGVPSDEPVLGKLIDNGRTAEAGLQEGDRIQTINGENMRSWTDIVNTVREHPEKEYNDFYLNFTPKANRIKRSVLRRNIRKHYVELKNLKTKKGGY